MSHHVAERKRTSINWLLITCTYINKSSSYTRRVLIHTILPSPLGSVFSLQQRMQTESNKVDISYQPTASYVEGTCMTTFTLQVAPCPDVEEQNHPHTRPYGQNVISEGQRPYTCKWNRQQLPTGTCIYMYEVNVHCTCFYGLHSLLRQGVFEFVLKLKWHLIFDIKNTLKCSVKFQC